MIIEPMKAKRSDNLLLNSIRLLVIWSGSQADATIVADLLCKLSRVSEDELISFINDNDFAFLAV